MMGWIMLILGILGIWKAVYLFTDQVFIAGGIYVFLSGYLLLGLKSIQEQERAGVELFGKYIMTLKPGLKWILPGAMKIRAIVPTWELTIPLFEEPIKIDFKDGSATPKNAEVFVEMQSPDTAYKVSEEEKTARTGAYRAIYKIENWRTATKNLVENAVRTFLNRLTIDDAIALSKAGYDLVNKDPDIGLPNEELEKIEKALADWGFSLKRITIQDFDLEPELIKARGEVHREKREAEASEYVRVKRARETLGALIQMMAESTAKSFEDMQKEVDTDPKLKEKMREFAQELVTRRMSIDGKALTDIRVGGGGDLEQVLLRLIAAIKGGG